MSVQGACLCGEVRYEVTGDPCDVAYCHCSECRRALGAAFAAYARIDATKFNWVTGNDLVSKFESSPGVFRCFCSRCGSQLGVFLDGDECMNWISLGTVSNDSGVHPEAHIFVASKASWYEITDDLPQFDEWPPESSEFFQRFN